MTTSHKEQHIYKEGSLKHIIWWDAEGRHCTEPNCEINNTVAEVAMKDEQRCQLCGTPVKVVGSDEGTMHYEPLKDEGLDDYIESCINAKFEARIEPLRRVWARIGEEVFTDADCNAIMFEAIKSVIEGGQYAK